MANQNPKTEFEIICAKLDQLNKLFEHSLVVQLYLAGATQDEIAKKLHIRKLTVNEIVRGIKRIK